MALDPFIRPPSSMGPLFEGIIRGNATSVTDDLEVVLPAFSPNHAFGPAPWAPRIDDLGDLELPTNGDRCCVGFAETDHPGAPEPWILMWWPS